MSSTNYGPCAACKLFRRKCTPECVFAPYFPQDQHQKFANVHKVFGASNVAKLLNELKIDQREDAVISLAFEAEARLRDPIYGCVGVISILQHRLRRVHQELYIVNNELANYIGPSAMFPMLQPPGFIQPHANNPTSPAIFPYNMQAPMLGLPAGQPPGDAQLVIQDQHHRQMLEAQQLAGVAAASEHQEMFRSYEQQSDQLLRLAAGRGQQEMLRSYEQQQAQQSNQLVRLAAARKQQEMYRSYEQQQAQQPDQLESLAAARKQQEMYRSYEQQQAQQSELVRLAAAREHQEMFRSYEQQAQQSDQLVRLAATTEQQEMFMGYEQQPQQSDQLVRLNAGFDTAGQVTASGFNQMALGGLTISPSLALGSYDNQQQQQNQPLGQPQVTSQQQHSAGSEEGRGVGPSC